MRAILVNLLLSAAVLAHTLLGCCWHHAHPGEASAAVTSVASAHHGCNGHLHNHAGSTGRDSPLVVPSGDEDEGSPHGHRHLCNEPDCMYVAGKTVRMEKPLPVALIAAAVVPQSDVCRHALEDRATDCGATRTTTLALRAVLQVWLI
jgi:hypothetical protein